MGVDPALAETLQRGEAAAAELAAKETDGLWSRTIHDEDASAVAFLRACGFTPRRERRDFEAPLEALLSHLSPLVERLRRRGLFREPEIVPLADAPLQPAQNQMRKGTGM